MKKTRGDVFRINITPAGTSFPWIRIFNHEFGIRRGGKEVSNEIGATKGKSRSRLAREIGEAIIKNSKVLPVWFKK